MHVFPLKPCPSPTIHSGVHMKFYGSFERYISTGNNGGTLNVTWRTPTFETGTFCILKAVYRQTTLDGAVEEEKRWETLSSRTNDTIWSVPNVILTASFWKLIRTRYISSWTRTPVKMSSKVYLLFKLRKALVRPGKASPEDWIW